MSLAATIAALGAHVENLAGLSRVHTAAPDTLNQLPAAVLYPTEGTMEANAAGGRSFHTIVVEIHHSRQVLPQAITDAVVWPDLMYAELKTATDLHIIWPIKYKAAGLVYGNETHYGVRFEVQAKVNET